MNETELKQLREKLYKELTAQLPKKGDISSFVVNTDYLKKRLEELYPGFEATITPIGAYEFEIVLKKMVTVIEIEIDQDKIMKKIKEEE